MEEKYLKFCERNDKSPFDGEYRNFSFGRKRKASPTAKVITDDEQRAIQEFMQRKREQSEAASET